MVILPGQPDWCSMHSHSVQLLYQQVYVAAMVPLFATPERVTGANPIILSLAILFSHSSGGCITHYGGAAGPIIFAVGYNDIKSWWPTGTIVALLTFVSHITVGFPW